MAKIQVLFEKEAPGLSAGIRLRGPGTDLWLTVRQAETLARMILLKVAKMGNTAK